MTPDEVSANNGGSAGNDESDAAPGPNAYEFTGTAQLNGPVQLTGTSQLTGTIQVTGANQPSAPKQSAPKPSATGKTLGQHLQSATFLLGVLACMLPIIGGAFVWVYAMHTPGSHWSYVGVGTLTAMAALLVGILVGFILGVPKLVSSGQVKVPDGSTSPNTNLGDISDWLTKLLLGAGLVSLGRLGGPIGRLIDNVATGLRTSAVNASVVATSKVAAGAILIAFAILGVLEGYVVTSVWYPAKLERLAAAANKLHANPPPATQPAGVTGPAGPSAAAAAANGGTAAPSVAVVASTGGPTRQGSAPATEETKG